MVVRNYVEIEGTMCRCTLYKLFNCLKYTSTSINYKLEVLLLEARSIIKQLLLTYSSCIEDRSSSYFEVVDVVLSIVCRSTYYVILLLL